MAIRKNAIIVKDDGHIDPKIWFGRYGIKYKSAKIYDQASQKETTRNNGRREQLLKITTSMEGLRRWRLGIQESKKIGTTGWHTLELRLYVMKNGTTEGFQFKQFNDYKKIVEFYA